jgi:hypothetical protein
MCETSAADCERSCCTDKKCEESLQNHQQRPLKYHFGHYCQVMPLIWNITDNSTVRLEAAADLSEVHALVVHWQAGISSMHLCGKNWWMKSELTKTFSGGS